MNALQAELDVMRVQGRRLSVGRIDVLTPEGKRHEEHQIRTVVDAVSWPVSMM